MLYTVRIVFLHVCALHMNYSTRVALKKGVVTVTIGNGYCWYSQLRLQIGGPLESLRYT